LLQRAIPKACHVRNRCLRCGQHSCWCDWRPWHLPLLLPSMGRDGHAARPQAVQQLLRLAPATAVLLTLDADGHVVEEEEIPIALVQRGDLLKVLNRMLLS
jgi:hypothetical protein